MKIKFQSSIFHDIALLQNVFTYIELGEFGNSGTRIFDDFIYPLMLIQLLQNYCLDL